MTDEKCPETAWESHCDGVTDETAGEAARRVNGRPLIGDEGFLEHLFAAFEAGHVTEQEWHQAERAHRLLVGSESERLLLAEEVAELLAVPVSWVRESTRSGAIPHVELGRYKRYRLEDVEAWLASCSKPGRAITLRSRS